MYCWNRTLATSIGPLASLHICGFPFINKQKNSRYAVALVRCIKMWTYIWSANNIEPVQTVWMCRLACLNTGGKSWSFSVPAWQGLNWDKINCFILCSRISINEQTNTNVTNKFIHNYTLDGDLLLYSFTTELLTFPK